MNITNVRWYAVVNDSVGGWSIATAGKPVSELIPPHEVVVADVRDEITCQYITNIHNLNIHGQVI